MKRKFSIADLILMITFLLFTTAIIYYSLLSRPEEILEGTAINIAILSNNILLHFVVYFFYSISCNVFLYRLFTQTNSLIFSIILSITLSLILEILQPYLNRDFSFEDFLFSAIGTMIGSLYSSVLLLILK